MLRAAASSGGGAALLGGRQLCLSLLSPPYASPAGFPGGAEAESAREAKAEKRVAGESESCEGERGAV